MNYAQHFQEHHKCPPPLDHLACMLQLWEGLHLTPGSLNQSLTRTPHHHSSPTGLYNEDISPPQTHRLSTFALIPLIGSHTTTTFSYATGPMQRFGMWEKSNTLRITTCQYMVLMQNEPAKQWTKIDWQCLIGTYFQSLVNLRKKGR